MALPSLRLATTFSAESNPLRCIQNPEKRRCPIKRDELSQFFTKDYSHRFIFGFFMNEAKDKILSIFAMKSGSFIGLTFVHKSGRIFPTKCVISFCCY
ncbi:hypothetical protein PanWU01x14_211770 [Parasponia andersonii]|uniref:Uncharacterized protein n=1 Tax=Parasponia andersonii TaxID=3476 RepID=A0A2P5BTD7_PARAD|nr:hypothetical protein PanWU01x14_211770 [Parasponia andersonii]